MTTMTNHQVKKLFKKNKIKEFFDLCSHTKIMAKYLFQVILGSLPKAFWPRFGGCVSYQLIFCSSCQFPMCGGRNVSNGSHSVFSCVSHGSESSHMRSPGSSRSLATPYRCRTPSWDCRSWPSGRPYPRSSPPLLCQNR